MYLCGKQIGMTVTTSFASQVFTSTIPPLALLTDETRVHVVIRIDTDEVYNEYLYPDSDGNIEILDMPGLVTPHVRHRLVADMEVELQEQHVTTGEDGEEDVDDMDFLRMSTKLIYCAALVDVEAEAFCRNNFLTLLQGKKITSLGRLEYLHYIGSEEATVTASYDDSTSATFTAAKVGGNDNYSTVDVSPSNFASEGKTLCAFTVYAGQRKQQFELDLANPDVAPVLLFTNSFGCQEIAYCLGTHTVSPEFKFSAAYIGVNKKNYEIEETRTFKADTGVLTYPMAFWLNDLFRSDEVQLLNFKDGEPEPGKMVVITDVKAEYDNNLDTLPRFTFSYEYAQKNHNVLDTARAGRIFDNTFDHTFN